MNGRTLCAVALLVLLGSALAGADEMCALQPCPGSPNCVSSGDPDAARRIPHYRPLGETEPVWAALLARARALPRSTVEAERRGYLHLSVRSRLFGFVDDLELRLCPESGLIALRSASRTGHWDMGVNAARVEDLLAPLLADGRLRADASSRGP